MNVSSDNFVDAALARKAYTEQKERKYEAAYFLPFVSKCVERAAQDAIKVSARSRELDLHAVCSGVRLDQWQTGKWDPKSKLIVKPTQEGIVCDDGFGRYECGTTHVPHVWLTW